MLYQDRKLESLMYELGDLAEQAGAKVMEYFVEDSLEVSLKQDTSPVTEADHHANRIIIEGLKKLAPEVPIISEEGTHPKPGDPAQQQFWLVDPLDGTREFIKNRKEFTVNIALIQEGYPVLGVIHLPAYGKTYMACRGLGCFRRERDGGFQLIKGSRIEGRYRLHIAVSKRLPSKEIKYGFRRFDEHFRHVIREPMGSSIKFCLVAEGSADAYPGFAEMSLWDCAAGQVLVEQAGGAMVDETGKRISYAPEQSLLITPFLAVGDRAYPWQEVAPFLNAI